MTYREKVKEDNCVIPQPMEGLHDHGYPPFLIKTYDMVDDPKTNSIVSWSTNNNSFIVWDCQNLANKLLPKYFKHSNYSSFVRQLYTYGFKKVCSDKVEFAKEGFTGGQRHLPKKAIRRKPMQLQSSQPTSSVCALEEEVYKLKIDHHVLMKDAMKIRQQQEIRERCLQAMEDKMKRIELDQEEMMSFLVRESLNA